MSSSNLNTVAYIYKNMYSGQKVGDLAMRDHPTLAMIPKQGDFKGIAHFYAVRYGNPQALSRTFSRAQGNITGSRGVQMQATRRRKYGFIRLDGESLAAAEGDRGSFLTLVTQETDGIVEEHGDDLAFQLHRDGTGSRGVAASITGNTILLANPDNVRWMKVGMFVEAANDAIGTTVRVGQAQVLAVDEDAGTFEVDAVTNIAGLSAGDHFFRSGSIGGAVEGFESHLPLVAPVFGSDSFRGVDRGQDARRLAGVRQNTPAVDPEIQVGDICVRINQVGKKADCAFLNPLPFQAMVNRLGLKVEYQQHHLKGMTADVGFEYVNVHTAAGAVKVYSDPDCPPDRGRVLKKSCWYYKTLRDFVHIVSDDGRANLRVSDEDQIEARTRSWGNLCCTEPGANGTFSLA